MGLESLTASLIVYREAGCGSVARNSSKLKILSIDEVSDFIADLEAFSPEAPEEFCAAHDGFPRIGVRVFPVGNQGRSATDHELADVGVQVQDGEERQMLSSGNAPDPAK